jgi:hypothetical protein
MLESEPGQSEKLDPESQNAGALEAHNGAVEVGSKWSSFGFFDQWSQIRIPQINSRIRIRIKEKGWILLRITENKWNRSRIRINVIGSATLVFSHPDPDRHQSFLPIHNIDKH